MKAILAATGLLVCLAEVNAFPSMTMEKMVELARRSSIDDPLIALRKEKIKRQSVWEPRQLTSTTGEHAFVAPDFNSGDQRGPCPGLNAAANHGYISHTGCDTWTNIYDGVTEAYGMAPDLAAFLALYGTIFDGNPLSLTPGYSIGGYHPKCQNILGNGLGLLGAAQGLSGSHNKYEADTSPTRGDQYVEGNSFMPTKARSQEYLDNVPAAPISAPRWYESLFPFRIKRFEESLFGNPNFFYSPFAGVIVTPAGYNFPPAFMANHSTEFPEGFMTKDIFKNFFGLTGPDDNIEVEFGMERIPNNWYRRPYGFEYTIPDFLGDVLEFAQRDIRLLSIGGNTGSNGSFFGIAPGDVIGGVLSVRDLLVGDNLACFVLQIVQAAAPDLLGGGITDTSVFQAMGQNILTFLAGKQCPELREYDNSMYDNYPGFNRTSGAV